MSLCFALTQNVDQHTINSTLEELSNLNVHTDDGFQFTLANHFTPPTQTIALVYTNHKPYHHISNQITLGFIDSPIFAWYPQLKQKVIKIITTAFNLIKVSPHHKTLSELNVWCNFDHADAIDRWTIRNKHSFDILIANLFNCHKCYRDLDARSFDWYTPTRTDYDPFTALLAAYEFGRAPSCKHCTPTFSSTPPPRSAFPSVYIKHIYNKEFTVACPTCNIDNRYRINTDKPVPRSLGHRPCRSPTCNGFEIITSYNLKVHTSIESYIEAITSAI
jgi:hypothetical protein